MNKLIPNFLKRFDAWLLQKFPRFWATQVHYLLWFIFCAAILLTILAWVTPVDFRNLYHTKEIEWQHSFLNNLDSFTILLAWVCFFVLLIWRQKLKARLNLTSFGLGLMTIFWSLAIASALFFTARSYKVIMEYRHIAIFDKNEIEKDLTLAYGVSRIKDYYQKLYYVDMEKFKLEDSICEIAGANYIFTKKEQIEIVEKFKVIDNFNDILSDTIQHERRLHSERKIDQKMFDSLTRIKHFQLIQNPIYYYVDIDENSTKKRIDIPDSLRITYKMNYDSIEKKFQWRNGLFHFYFPRICTANKYLHQKYGLVDNEDVLQTLEQYFCLQQQPFLNHFFNNNYANFFQNNCKQKGENFMHFHERLNLNKEIEVYKSNLQSFKDRSCYFSDEVKISFFTLYLTLFCICLITLSNKDIIIILATQLVGYVAVWTTRFIPSNIWDIFTIFALGLAVLAFIYFIFVKKQKIRRIGQIALMMISVGANFFSNRVIDFFANKMNIKISVNDQTYLSLVIAFIVVWLMIVFYQRLSLSPKEK